MKPLSYPKLAERIIEKAKLSGASIAGIASVEILKTSPSHLIYPIIGMSQEKHITGVNKSEATNEIAWPKDALSAVVIGVEHSIKEPGLDYWDGKGTPGNRILIKIAKELSEWIETELSIKTYKLPYFVEKGGIFLKDAAVMAGLGCVGKNNLLITPEFGPRVRFRALLMEYNLKTSGPADYNPCKDCEQPCRKSCPINAFQKAVYSPAKIGQSILPGINGTYDRMICNNKMEKDIEEAITGGSGLNYENVRSAINEFEQGYHEPTGKDLKSKTCVKYCRICELTCPIGKLAHCK